MFSVILFIYYTVIYEKITIQKIVLHISFTIAEYRSHTETQHFFLLYHKSSNWSWNSDKIQQTGCWTALLETVTVCHYSKHYTKNTGNKVLPFNLCQVLRKLIRLTNPITIHKGRFTFILKSVFVKIRWKSDNLYNDTNLIFKCVFLTQCLKYDFFQF